MVIPLRRRTLVYLAVALAPYFLEMTRYRDISRRYPEEFFKISSMCRGWGGGLRRRCLGVRGGGWKGEETLDEHYDKWRKKMGSDGISDEDYEYDDRDCKENRLDSRLSDQMTRDLFQISRTHEPNLGLSKYVDDGWRPMLPPTLPSFLPKRIRDNRTKTWEEKIIDRMSLGEKVDIMEEARKRNRHKMWEWYLNRMDNIIKDPERRDVMHYVAKMDLIQKSVNWEAAVSLKDAFYEEAKNRIRRDKKHFSSMEDLMYNILLMSCHRARPKAWQKILELYAERDNLYHRRDSITFDALIHAYYDGNKWEKALAAMDDMTKSFVRVEYEHYEMFTTTLRILNRQKLWWRAMSLLEYMDRVSVSVSNQIHITTELTTMEMLRVAGFEVKRLEENKKYGNMSQYYLPNGQRKPLVVEDRDGDRYFPTRYSRFHVYNYKPCDVDPSERHYRKEYRDLEKANFTLQEDKRRYLKELDRQNSGDWKWWE
ncbi:hypothetical protein AAMO2058_001308700 [Amorphochlora amoebiformis]